MARSPSADRRRLLGLALAGASTLWIPRAAWSVPRLSHDPFGLGVASGSPDADSVVLWTRLLAEPGVSDGLPLVITLGWEVAEDEAFSRIVRRGQTEARAELAHSVHVEVGGLRPDRWYFYRFTLGQAVSPMGRTRTLPAPGAAVARWRLAYASCQRWDQGYFAAYRHMAEEDVDTVLFLGDYIYEYPGTSNPVRPGPGAWAVSLEDYRARYALYKSDPDLQAMHARCPWFLTWDDHEVQNDYAGALAGESGPPGMVDFAARRAGAYQAYYEHQPLRAAVLTRGLAGLGGGSSAAEMRIHGRADFGRLASLYMLDDRQYRDPHVCVGDGGRGSRSIDPAACAALWDPARSMLGASQEAWLGRALSQPSPGWNLIGQQTLFGRLDRRAGPGELLWNDGWDGYPAARARLTDTLRANRVANPVVFGGDVHQNWVGQVKADYRDPASRPVGVEFCGTSVSSRGPSVSQVAERLAENPHFVFADGSHRGYGVADFSPARLSVRLRVLDDATRKDAAVQTLASFTVETGRPLVLRD